MDAATRSGIALGALRVGPALLARGAPAGPLRGLQAVVKDVFDVAGERTGAGNPDFLRERLLATEPAWAVGALIDAGADIVGKAHTDELAFSLSGTNVHYGTPINVRAPGHIPGGSSAGSAAAVAAGIVPLALATDTAGSTRVPASYCGLFGYRPSHGLLPMTGVIPLAPSFDTVGVLAATGSILATAGRVLLRAAGHEPRVSEAEITHIVVADDLLAHADDGVRAAFADAVAGLAGSLSAKLGYSTLAGDRLTGWRDAFTARQLVEVWATHGAWVTSRRPGFGPGISGRLAAAAQADPARAGLADPARAEIVAAIDALLPPGAVLALPSTSSVAPHINLGPSEKDLLRRQTLLLTCIASLAGLPAVSLPLASVGGLPVGVGLVARSGQDGRLLGVAARADVIGAPAYAH